MLFSGLLRSDFDSSPLEIITTCVALFVMVAWVVNRSLLFNEYQSRTNLFLESLPLRRLEWITVKYLLGLAFVWLIAAQFLIVQFSELSQSEVLSVRFVTIVTTRLAVFCAWVHATFFFLSFLGNYRLPAAYMLITVAYYWVDLFTGADVFAPVNLLFDRFSFEREYFPVVDLRDTILITIGLIAAAAVLGWVWAGGLVNLFYSKTSLRGQVIAWIIVLAVCESSDYLPNLSGVLTSPAKPYIDLRTSLDLGHDAVLSIPRDLEQQLSADVLAGPMQSDLKSLIDYLNEQQPASLLVDQRGTLAGSQYEQPNDVDGIAMVLVDSRSKDFRYQSIAPIVIDAWLENTFDLRQSHESVRWVFQGLSQYWPSRRLDPGGLSVDQQLDRRAMVAWSLLTGSDHRPSQLVHLPAGSDQSTPDFGRWLQVERRLGKELTGTLAGNGLVMARQFYGPEKLQQFFQHLLGNDPSGRGWGVVRASHLDAGSVVREWDEIMGDSFQRFTDRWFAALDQRRTEFAEIIDAVPQLRATAQVTGRTEYSYRLHLDYLNVGSDNSPAPARTAELVYGSVDPFGRPGDPTNWFVETHELSREGRLTAKRQIQRGQTIDWHLRTFASTLDCYVSSGWQRTLVVGDDAELSITIHSKDATSRNPASEGTTTINVFSNEATSNDAGKSDQSKPDRGQ